MFKVGDRVMLKDSSYAISNDNPTNTIGMVTEIRDSTKDTHPIDVIWANNEHNVYKASDLYYPHKLDRLLAGVEDAEITE